MERMSKIRQKYEQTLAKICATALSDHEFKKVENEAFNAADKVAEGRDWSDERERLKRKYKDRNAINQREVPKKKYRKIMDKATSQSEPLSHDQFIAVEREAREAANTIAPLEGWIEEYEKLKQQYKDSNMTKQKENMINEYRRIMLKEYDCPTYFLNDEEFEEHDKNAYAQSSDLYPEVDWSEEYMNIKKECAQKNNSNKKTSTINKYKEIMNKTMKQTMSDEEFIALEKDAFESAMGVAFFLDWMEDHERVKNEYEDKNKERQTSAIRSEYMEIIKESLSSDKLSESDFNKVDNKAFEAADAKARSLGVEWGDLHEELKFNCKEMQSKNQLEVAETIYNKMMKEKANIPLTKDYFETWEKMAFLKSNAIHQWNERWRNKRDDLKVEYELRNKQKQVLAIKDEYNKIMQKINWNDLVSDQVFEEKENIAFESADQIAIMYAVEWKQEHYQLKNHYKQFQDKTKVNHARWSYNTIMNERSSIAQTNEQFEAWENYAFEESNSIHQWNVDTSTGSISSDRGVSKSAKEKWSDERDEQKEIYRNANNKNQVIEIKNMYIGIMDRVNFGDLSNVEAFNKEENIAYQAANAIANKYSVDWKDDYDELKSRYKYSYDSSKAYTSGNVYRNIMDKKSTLALTKEEFESLEKTAFEESCAIHKWNVTEFIRNVGLRKDPVKQRWSDEHDGLKQDYEKKNQEKQMEAITQEYIKIINELNWDDVVSDETYNKQEKIAFESADKIAKKFPLDWKYDYHKQKSVMKSNHEHWKINVAKTLYQALMKEKSKDALMEEEFEAWEKKAFDASNAIHGWKVAEYTGSVTSGDYLQKPTNEQWMDERNRMKKEYENTNKRNQIKKINSEYSAIMINVKLTDLPNDEAFNKEENIAFEAANAIAQTYAVNWELEHDNLKRQYKQTYEDIKLLKAKSIYEEIMNEKSEVALINEDYDILEKNAFQKANAVYGWNFNDIKSVPASRGVSKLAKEAWSDQRERLKQSHEKNNKKNQMEATKNEYKKIMSKTNWDDLVGDEVFEEKDKFAFQSALESAKKFSVEESLWENEHIILKRSHCQHHENAKINEPRKIYNEIMDKKSKVPLTNEEFEAWENKAFEKSNEIHQWNVTGSAAVRKGVSKSAKKAWSDERERLKRTYESQNKKNQEGEVALKRMFEGSIKEYENFMTELVNSTPLTDEEFERWHINKFQTVYQRLEDCDDYNVIKKKEQMLIKLKKEISLIKETAYIKNKKSQEELEVILHQKTTESKQAYNDAMNSKCKGVSDEDFEEIHKEAITQAKSILESVDVGKESDLWKKKSIHLEEIFLIEKQLYLKINASEIRVRENNAKMEQITKLHNKDAKMKNTSFYSSNKVLGVVGDEGFLGRGGFGRVQLGFIDALGFVAIKCIAIHGSRNDIDHKSKKFSQEIEMIRKASHENVVRVEGLTSWKDALGMIMEYMPGGSLHSLLLNKSDQFTYCVPDIPVALRLRFCVDVTSGVTFLHNSLLTDQRLTHGDLKCENILLTSDLRCKLADFGGADIATVTEEASLDDDNVRRGELTRIYAAPERLLGSISRVSKLMDVYSVSMIFYETLGRQRPKPSGMSTADYLAYILAGNRPDSKCIDDSLQSLCDGDIEIVNLLKEEMTKCWNQEADARPAMMSVRDDLLRCLSTKNQALIAQHVADVTKHMIMKQPYRHQVRCASINHFAPPMFESDVQGE